MISIRSANRAFGCLTDAIDHTRLTYRRSLWTTADCYVEIWIEKDALAGVIYDVTAEWDVPLMSARGYSSLPFIYSSAAALREQDRPCYIYHLGDHDPSGVDAARAVERTLREMEPGVDLTFERLAVTPAQIAEWNLPSRPTKASDPRAKAWSGGNSVELDAIPAPKLREVVGTAIERHVDLRRLKTIMVAEESERQALDFFAAQFEGDRE